MERGLKIPPKERTKTTSALLVSLINQLEKDKKSLTLGSEDNLYVEGFALNVFSKADKQDRAGKADVNTAKTFYAASIFFEILHQFGEIAPEIEQKQKYAAWKAADIRKAIKEGRKPQPGPPGGEDFTVNDFSLQVPSDHPLPDVPQFSKHQDTARSFPDREARQDSSLQFSDSTDHALNKVNSHSTFSASDYQNVPSHGSISDYETTPSNRSASEYQAKPQYGSGIQSPHDVPDHMSGNPDAYPSSYYRMPSANDTHSTQLGSAYGYPSTGPSNDSYNAAQPYAPSYQAYPNLHNATVDSQTVNHATYPSNPLHYQHASETSAGTTPYHLSTPQNTDYQPNLNYSSISNRDEAYGGTEHARHPSSASEASPVVGYSYNSSYQPPPDKIAEAHKAARLAVGSLAFDDVPAAVDYLKRSLELLTIPSTR
eukprot:TRINITY_DN2798_c0_g1_i3.p1 TRINITY_DN2798_c0_g1~~TRINITY_DN2798_c0_g1_i3.p1  ORF type:complete len:428 (+),score=95.08 TRINITY_DN2798_c0_g1_i3:451-1734(+)